MTWLYFKHRIVRSPFELPAKIIQKLSRLPKILLHPGMMDIFFEDYRLSKIVSNFLESDSNCIDIGAHIGSTLSNFCRLAPMGSHTAFEPLAQKASWLEEKFPEVDVYCLALGNEVGTTNFFENASRPGFSSLSDSNMKSDDLVRTEIRIEKLDNIIPPAKKIDLIKIDVEGAELNVLLGGAELIRKNHPLLIFESGPGGAAAHGYDQLDLYDWLVEKAGYKIYFPKNWLLQKGPLSRAAFDQSHKYPFGAFNYVASHDR